ncbi:MAG: phosphoesterase [Pirellulaceae bacterium]
MFHSLGNFQGFSTQVERYLDALLCADHIRYRPRSEMEEDPSFKQLIPYVIFRHQAGPTETIFHYKRGRGQGEKRLHAKRSIGVGGHISSDDETPGLGLHPYEEGMRRELAEEVQIGCAYESRLVGLINDDLTEVGKVHLGLVHVFDVASPDVQPREADIQDTGFAPPRDLLRQIDEFESWSQICLRALFSGE